MAFTVNKIDNLDFITLEGAIVPPYQRSELLQRPGLDGTQITRIGSKGEPFELISTVDAKTVAHASQLYDSYLAKVVNQLYDVEQHSVKTSTRMPAFKCAVLEVKELEKRAIETPVGNTFNPPSKALLVCRWVLIAELT